MSDSFPHLFSPIAIGKYTLKNRIMNTGHAAHFQTGDGLPTQRYVDYGGVRAKGGAGIVVTGHTVPYYTPFTGVREIEDGSVEAYNVISWQPRTVEGIGTVVFAAGGVAEDGLGAALAGRVAEVHVIGDCYQPRDIEVAVVDGIILLSSYRYTSREITICKCPDR